jgi:hypothetical protein
MLDRTLSDRQVAGRFASLPLLRPLLLPLLVPEQLRGEVSPLPGDEWVARGSVRLLTRLLILLLLLLLILFLLLLLRFLLLLLHPSLLRRRCCCRCFLCHCLLGALQLGSQQLVAVSGQPRLQAHGCLLRLLPLLCQQHLLLLWVLLMPCIAHKERCEAPQSVSNEK